MHAINVLIVLDAVVVCAVQGQMPSLLSHYRPDCPIYAFTENRDIQRRLALYHGVTALYMPFTPNAEETFERYCL